MILVVTPALVCLVGLLVFVLSGRSPNHNPDVKRLGEHMFWTGLLVTLMTLKEWHRL